MVTGGAAALSKPVLGSSEKTSTRSPDEAYKYSPLESVQRDAMGDAVLAMRYGFPATAQVTCRNFYLSARQIPSGRRYRRFAKQTS